MFGAWLRLGNQLPPNVTVRFSAHMLDELPDLIPGSAVTTGKHPWEDAHYCPAKSQGNKCGDCRMCWDNEIPVVVYPNH